jgi:hypothetical protein
MSVLDADAAMEARTDLWNQLQNPEWMRLTAGWVRTAAGETHTPDDNVPAVLDGFVAGIHTAIRLGETFAVSPDIGVMLADAAPTMPSYTITAADAPAPAGFVHFTGGLVTPDCNGDRIVVRAMTWASQMVVFGGEDPTPGFVGAVLTDPLDERDSSSHVYRTDPDMVAGLRRPGMRAATHWSPISIIVWQHGQPFDMGRDRTDHVSLAVLAALWRFVREPYVSDDAERASRPVAKRASRAGVEPSPLRVVRLRRRAGEHPVGSGSQRSAYSHRFIVSGHWRNQWYPSLGDHRPRYIAPYVKGPDEAPVMVRDTIFTVDR